MSAIAEETGTPPQPPRSPVRKTARDMVLSLAVIVAIVGLFIAIVPRPNAVRQPAVDLRLAVIGARERVTFEPAIGQGLPAGWVPVSANVLRGTDGLLTWQVSYTTPDDTYAAVRQASGATRAWESRQVTDGREDGTITLGGEPWVVRSRTDRDITSWVRRGPEVTTIVTGTADPADLRVLAESLDLTAPRPTPTASPAATSTP